MEAPARSFAASVSQEALTSTPRPTAPRPTAPLTKCEYCLGVGHSYLECKARASDYRCPRCLDPRHKEVSCAWNTKKCVVCSDVGHSSALHSVTDQEERFQIIS